MAGCDLPGKPDPANRPIPVNKIVDFDVLYQTHCSGCHGETGSFGPAPPLNDPLFLKIVSEDELLEVITHGRAGTPMPAFVESQGGPLTAEQVRVLATGLKPRWQDPPPALAAEAPPYAAPANNPALAARGAELFATACANCHGAEGEGMDEDDAGHRNAINNAAFLSLISDQALRRLMITGRADLGMPNFTEAEGRDGDFHPLTSDDLDALVALLSTWRESGSQPSAISYQPIQKKSLADSR